MTSPTVSGRLRGASVAAGPAEQNAGKRRQRNQEQGDVEEDDEGRVNAADEAAGRRRSWHHLTPNADAETEGSEQHYAIHRARLKRRWATK